MTGMKRVDRRKLIIAICIAAAIIMVCFGTLKVVQLVKGVEQTENYSVESLQWTIIGAIGSWVGSIFGAIALIVSFVAPWLPQQVKIAVSLETGIMSGAILKSDSYVYVIIVKNIGMKPITIENIYLHFGDKEQCDIFIGSLNLESTLQIYTPTFPKRLEQGESLKYYLSRERLNRALADTEKGKPLSMPLSIRVDEVTKGTKYYKTKWKLQTFIGAAGQAVR